LDNEFRRYGIPQKWRKWIWIGTISGLIYIIKWLAAENKRLDKEVKECNAARMNDAEMRRKADSTMIYKVMEEAFYKSKEKIIQPVLDSASKSQL